MSGISPHLTSITDSRASGAAIRMSAPSAICRPPPSTEPCSAAMTGIGSVSQSCEARWNQLGTSPRMRSVSGRVGSDSSGGWRPIA